MRAGEVDKECEGGHNPLTLACSLADVAMVKTLLRYQASINFETSRGRTALGEAFQASNAKLVFYLLSQRADLDYTNRFGVPSIRLAKEWEPP